MAGNPSFTIIVNVDTSKTPPTLTYSDDGGPGGISIGAKKHRILNNCDVSWCCPQAPVFIQFTGSRKIFTNNVPGNQLSVTAPANTKTPALTTKNNIVKRTTKYFVAVASSPMAGEDPEFDDGGGGGGNVRKSGTKKKAAKKAKAKKATAK
jgi:hypothetical protein